MKALCFLVICSDTSAFREGEDVIMAPHARSVEDVQPTAGGTPQRNGRVVPKVTAVEEMEEDTVRYAVDQMHSYVSCIS